MRRFFRKKLPPLSAEAQKIIDQFARGKGNLATMIEAALRLLDTFEKNYDAAQAMAATPEGRQALAEMRPGFVAARDVCNSYVTLFDTAIKTIGGPESSPRPDLRVVE